MSEQVTPQGRGWRANDRRWMPWASFLLLWLALGSLAWDRAAPPGFQLHQVFGAFAMADYRDSVWLPVDDFVRGGVPWDRAAFEAGHPGAMFYPLYVPVYWWATGWLLLLPYGLAAALWMGALCAALVWIVHRSLTLFCPGALDRRPWLVPALTLASLGLRPVQTALSQGNWALLCAAGAIAALTWSGSPRPSRPHFPPGQLLAVVKPPVGLALFIALLLTRRTAAALRGVLVIVLLCLPIAVLVVARSGGLAQAAHILLATLRDGDGARAGDSHYTRLDAPATLERLWPGAGTPAMLLVALLAAALTLGVGALATRRHGRLDARAITPLLFGIFWVTPNLHYALTVAWPALVALPFAALAARRRHDRLAGACAAAAWLLLLGVFISPVRGGTRLGVTPQRANLAYGLCLAGAAALVAVWSLRSAPGQLVAGEAPSGITGPGSA